MYQTMVGDSGNLHISYDPNKAIPAEGLINRIQAELEHRNASKLVISHDMLAMAIWVIQTNKREDEGKFTLAEWLDLLTECFLTMAGIPPCGELTLELLQKHVHLATRILDAYASAEGSDPQKIYDSFGVILSNVDELNETLSLPSPYHDGFRMALLPMEGVKNLCGDLIRPAMTRMKDNWILLLGLDRDNEHAVIVTVMEAE